MKSHFVRLVRTGCLLIVSLVAASAFTALAPAGADSPSAVPGAGASCATACTPPLVNKGGLVQANPTIYLIFWGPNWNATTGVASQQQVATAVKNMVGSLNGTPYANILAQYLGATNSAITLGGTWQDQTVPPATVNRAAVAAEVDAAITANPTWVAGNNSQFMVFTQAGTNVPAFASDEEPSDFCAYHDHAASSVMDRGQLIFDLEPWFGDASFANCVGLYSNPANLVDAETTVATHEIAEAATDPIWDTNPAWITNNAGSLYEIGDLCAYPGVAAAPVVGKVQLLWDNASGTCTNAAGVPNGGATPEAPAALLLPLSGGLVVAGVLVAKRRRSTTTAKPAS